MTNKVTYNDEALLLIRKLAEINKKLTIKKSEDGKHILINSQNPSRSIVYELKAPIDFFDFEGDTISFFDYKEFFTLLSVNDDPIISQNGVKLEITKNRAKLQYHLADLEAVEDEDEEYVAFEESHATVKITAETLKTFKTMASLTKAEELTFKVEGDKLLIKLFNIDTEPSYEEDFDLESPATEDFEFVVDPEVIKLAPENDYVIDLHSSGVIKFTYKNNINIDLNLYIAESEEK